MRRIIDQRVATLLFVVACLLPFGATSRAADNEVTEAEKRDGWLLLFDGTSLAGWQTSTQKPSSKPVEEGALNPHGCGGYMLIHERPWSDFILSLDFKIAPKCNSGIFLRTWPLMPREGKDVGFNGIEVAVDDTTTAGMHDTGAIYDLVAPAKNAMKPAGQWNHIEITCDGPKISVVVNGQPVTSTNLDEWTQPNRRPDGSEHKFDVVYRDHPRRGYLGLQDHGGECWYKNIKLKPLGDAKSQSSRRSQGRPASLNSLTKFVAVLPWAWAVDRTRTSSALTSPRARART